MQWQTEAYLADDRKVPPVHVKAVDAQREDRRQSHHAAHGGHVVQVGLRVLDVSSENTL